ncbi:MAG: hypothetical protein E7430_07260 [Ruminococcaceae bacterium]|nr:hypothetical protein [Oscillospiraceae bacterium]
MAADILRLKFEAEQKRSRQIEKKLNDMAPERIPDNKKTVVPTMAPIQTEKQEPAQKKNPVEPELKAVKTANHVRSTMISGKMSLKDAIVMSEIISKPVSKRR